jgi:hypothetical protein
VCGLSSVERDFYDRPVAHGTDDITFKAVDQPARLETEIPNGAVDDPTKVLCSVQDGPARRAEHKVRGVCLVQNGCVRVHERSEPSKFEFNYLKHRPMLGD